MTNYLVGLKLEGFETLEIEDKRLREIKDSTVVIALREDSNGKLYQYYASLKRLILNGNRTILLIVGSESKIKLQLCMLMASYEKYDMYNIDDAARLTKDYINIIIARKPTKEEVDTFIGHDIIAYTDINEILLELLDAIDKVDIDRVSNVAAAKRDIIESAIHTIDFIKRHIDKYAIEKDAIIELEEKIKEKEEIIRGKDKELKEAKDRELTLQDTNNILKKDAFKAKSEAQDLREQLNSSGPVINTYAEVQTTLIKCKAKSILYFKEVTYVRYVNSFILKLMETIQKLKKLKVKLVIYDTKNSFTAVYKPISVIGSSEYVANREAIINTMDKLVLVEPNPAIIEDILKADYDVVIIYDRLRQATDIVTGNNVYKYWVINSSQEYNALATTFKIDKQHVITRPGVFPDCLTIWDVPNYKDITVSAKMAAYIKMDSPLDNKKKILDTIFERTNIVSIPPRG